MHTALASRMLALLAISVLAIALAACEREPRIDASTDQTTEESVDRIAAMMSDEDAELFRQAINVLVMHETVAVALDDDRDLSPAEQQAAVEERVRQRLHNRTADEVVQQVLDIAEDDLGPDAVPDTLRQ